MKHFARLLFLLAIPSFWSLSGTVHASVDFEYCSSEEYEAERYLRPLGTFEVYAADSPACSLEAQQIGAEGVSGFGWIECLILLALAVGFGVGVARCHRLSATPFAVGLAVLTLVCVVLGAENAARIVGVDRALKAGHDAFLRGDSKAVLAAISSAEGHQRGAWLPRLGLRSSALGQMDLGPLEEKAGVCAVADTLARGETAEAVRLLSDFSIRTEVGRDAHIAALTQDTRAQLEFGETAVPVRHSVQALNLRPEFEPLHSNLSIARYHHAVGLARAGDGRAALELAKALDEPMSGISIRDREALRGFSARIIAGSLLEDPQAAEPDKAVAVLEEAHAYALEHGNIYVFINCDLAAALEADAILELARRRPGEAVRALDRSDELVPGREVVTKLRPQALLAHGSQLLSERQFEPAISNLRRAFDETGGADANIRQTLGLAWYSAGGDAHDKGQLDEAITAYKEAVDVIPKDDNVRFSLGEALSARADDSFKAGSVEPAADDLKQAARYSHQHRDAAQQRLRYVSGMSERIAAIRSSAGFIQAPDIIGELPRDLDGDGRVDQAIYYGPSQTPVAVAPAKRGPRPATSVAVTSNSPSGSAVAVLRDLDHDGRYDERVDYTGGELSDLWTDIDGDAVPDVRGIEFNRDAFEFRQQPLSGRVVMHVKGGVISSVEDFFSDPDAYLRLKKNSRNIGRTSTSMDTYYPTWYEGVTLDYKFGDRVRLELWDEDLFSDDLIDVYETAQLPTSGIYQFASRKAAVEVDVRPSTLPEGHQVAFDAPAVNANIFRDHPTAVPVVADIVAGARGAEATTRAIQFVTKAVVLNVLLPRLLPRASGWQRFAAELVVEHGVLDPAMGLDD